MPLMPGDRAANSLREHVEGEVLFRNYVVVRATRSDDGWSVRYNLADDRWSESRGSEVPSDDEAPYIPLESARGFKGKLRLRYTAWRYAVSAMHR